MKESNLFVGRTAIQIIVDRFFRQGEDPTPIKGRVLKQWDDRMPNWEPNSKGDYTNDYFYGGNLKGVEAKLEYLHSLGFDLIYLTPIVYSDSYHHYDVGNQAEIDPWIGTWEDLRSLCKRAKELGIIIIVDVVFNHTGTSSVYYNDSKYSEWYKRDSKGNPIFWWGFKDLAEVDTTNKSYQREMTKCIEKYLECGVNGFRYDLGEGISREFFQYVNRVKTKYPDTIFIIEMWGIATDKDDPKILDGQVDSLMNYPLADGILRWCAFGNSEHFKNRFNRVYTEYPRTVQNVLLNNIATHDTPTTMTMLAGITLYGNEPVMNPDVYNGSIWDIEGPWRNSKGFDTYGFRLFEAEHDKLTVNQYGLAENLTKVAIAILYTIPGIPCLLQGTETGDTGFKDPFCRKPYNWKATNCTLNAFVSLMGKIRKDNKDILAEGATNLATCTDRIIVLERFDYKGHRLVLAVNRSSEPQAISIINDCSNLKAIFTTGNSSKNYLDAYGIMIAREN